MEFGAHLPLIVPSPPPPTGRDIVEYALLAESLGFSAVSANDHVLFRTGWLDGPTALAAVSAVTTRVQLATTVLIPALRNPVVAAKMLGTLDILSGGRLIVGVSAGSYAPDYAACHVPFEERWKRLDASIRVLRQLWREEPADGDSSFYPLGDIRMDPKPAQRLGPPLWVGSWGSPAGLRRVARLGDGWMASAYNTTPTKFAADWESLQGYLREIGKDPTHFPNAVVTMFSYVTDDAREAEDIARTILSPALGRPVEELKAKLLLGEPGECAEKIVALARAGAQRIFIWPAADARRQLRLFAERIFPLLR